MSDLNEPVFCGKYSHREKLKEEHSTKEGG